MTDVRDKEEVQLAKPWRWPMEWMRDEKFWRDVGSRFLAGLFVVIIVFVVGRVSGYIERPDVKEGLDPIFNGLIPFVGVMIVFVLLVVGCTNIEMAWKYRNKKDTLTSGIYTKFWAWGTIELVVALYLIGTSIWSFSQSHPTEFKRIIDVITPS